MRESRASAGNVLCRLLLNAGEGVAFRLGLDNTDGFAVHEESVVWLAGLKGHLADCNAQGGTEVDSVLVLHGPAATPQKDVDDLTGLLFWRFRHG